MKKLILIFLTLLILAGCGGRETASSEAPSKSSTPSLSITVMPSPPETKTTQDNAEIRKYKRLGNIGELLRRR